MKQFGKYFWKAIKIISYLVIIGTVLYIMSQGLGLIKELDFGAGAYYYADIPQFAKYVNGEHFHSKTPMWVLIGLFLIWGHIMYQLWSWLERKL